MTDSYSGVLSACNDTNIKSLIWKQNILQDTENWDNLMKKDIILKGDNLTFPYHNS